MTRAILLTCLVTLLGCGPDSSSKSKPAGTMSDPVETCEHSGDVCRIGPSKLGVCTHAKSGAGLMCASQH